MPSRRTGLAASLSTLAALLPAGAAHAAPLTLADPGGSGASVTISDSSVVPGQRVAISGEGFVPVSGHGFPLVAIKPYDLDPPWAFGGADAHPGTDDARIWFVAQQPSGGDPKGAFTGTIDIGDDLTPDGLASGPARGTHWLRILSGAFSTADAVTVPITYKVPFTVERRLALGLSSFGSPTLFQPGTTFRPGAAVTPRGRSFDAAESVTVTLDGTPVAASITTDAEGDFPAGARVTLPGATAPGAHTLTFATSTITASAPIAVIAPPTVALDTPTVRPGGRFAVRFTNFIGVGGAGQKVAIVVDEKVLACLRADASGAATGTAVLPAGTALGTATVGFAAGTSCLGPTGAQDDLPGARLTAPLSVATEAPAVRAPDAAAAGSTIAVSGDGLAPDQAVAVTLDGAPLSSALRTAADGTLRGDLVLPAETTPGERVLLFKAGATSAVAALTVTENVVSPVTAAPVAGLPVPPVPEPPVAITPGKARAPVLRTVRVLSGARRLRLTLTGTAARKTTISVKTAKKVRLTTRGKAKTVTLATITTNKVGTITLTLTGDGRRLLGRVRSVKVVVRIGAPGRTTTIKTVTLRR
jgi:hypothetical protein